MPECINKLPSNQYRLFLTSRVLDPGNHRQLRFYASTNRCRLTRTGGATLVGTVFAAVHDMNVCPRKHALLLGHRFWSCSRHSETFRDPLYVSVSEVDLLFLHNSLLSPSLSLSWKCSRCCCPVWPEVSKKPTWIK